jgi:hypothetical protein
VKPQREFFVYCGQRCIGRVIVAGDGGARVFGGAGKSFGKFPNQKTALAAINAACPSKHAARTGKVRGAKTRFVNAVLSAADAGQS